MLSIPDFFILFIELIIACSLVSVGLSHTPLNSVFLYGIILFNAVFAELIAESAILKIIVMAARKQTDIHSAENVLQPSAINQVAKRILQDTNDS